MKTFQIITDSCCDLSKEVRKEYDLDYFRMGININGEIQFADIDFEDYTIEQLYDWVGDRNNRCKTTLPEASELDFKMRKYLEKGMDILYIGCSSALTGTMNLFNIVKSQLLEEFPDRKIIGVDSLIASAGLGMLAIDASIQQRNGKTIEEVEKWVHDHKFFYNQVVTVDTLKYLKEAGRIKGTAAFFGDIIGVKPIFISDRKGNNFVTQKVKGTKNAMNTLFEETKAKIHKDEYNKVFICHAVCEDKALALKERLEKELGVEVIITFIGPIVGITCGPGTIGVFCYGEEVTRYDGDGL